MPDRILRTPQYRHDKPKDLAVVRIDGRDVYLGKYSSPESHEKYWRVVAEWNLTGALPAPSAPPATAPAEVPPTVSELIGEASALPPELQRAERGGTLDCE